ncbi:MAG TPA: cob(I)yrinic acid a,c-diamide adenosyltransferase [Dehalococcoidia bacterium]|nr:cob(I)yrinic acid a,c-diamide adenosyltransferase [Dehalococcoidia bacterium]
MLKLRSPLRRHEQTDISLMTGKKAENSPRKGLVEVFTGNGRGKTSAAMGVVLRALGHDLKICIIFFMKGKFPYGEQKTLAKFPNVNFTVFGSLDFVDPRNVREEDKKEARKALQAGREAMLSGKYDLVVLDEINVAAAWGLIGVEDIIKLIEDKPEQVELILTGRYADPRIVKQADLVTEMVAIKHPFDEGVKARAGLDY